jgi:hypothetical protein
MQDRSRLADPHLQSWEFFSSSSLGYQCYHLFFVALTSHSKEILLSHPQDKVTNVTKETKQPRQNFTLVTLVTLSWG